jgi:hypothetical protein
MLSSPPLLLHYSFLKLAPLLKQTFIELKEMERIVVHLFFCFLIWINVFCFALMQRGATHTVISFTIHQDDLDVNLINVMQSLLLCVFFFSAVLFCLGCTSDDLLAIATLAA